MARSQGQGLVEFANAALHERSWREVVHAASVEWVGEVPIPPSGPVVGVSSVDQAIEIQRDLRQALNVVVDTAEGASFAKREAVARLIDERVKLRVTYGPAAHENRLFKRWETAEGSLKELLYVKLAESLEQAGFAAYRCCPACGKFIFRRSGHGQRYCNDRCRALAGFRRKKRRLEGVARDAR